jgi:hypothetical protein
LAGPWGDWNSTSCASANSSPREVGPLFETEVPGNRSAVVHDDAGMAMGSAGAPFAVAGAARRLAVGGEPTLECGHSVLGWCRIAWRSGRGTCSSRCAMPRTAAGGTLRTRSGNTGPPTPPCRWPSALLGRPVKLFSAGGSSSTKSARRTERSDARAPLARSRPRWRREGTSRGADAANAARCQCVWCCGHLHALDSVRHLECQALPHKACLYPVSWC